MSKYNKSYPICSRQIQRKFSTLEKYGTLSMFTELVVKAWALIGGNESKN